jgi:UDP-N-acetylglucosamine transferase subunit ALG13
MLTVRRTKEMRRKAIAWVGRSQIKPTRDSMVEFESSSQPTFRVRNHRLIISHTPQGSWTGYTVHPGSNGGFNAPECVYP